MYAISVLVFATVVCLSQSMPLIDLVAPQMLETDTNVWRSCGVKHVKINEIKVDGCDSSPCKVRKGENITVTIKFTADIGYKELINVMCADMQVACVTFVLPKPSVCKNLVDEKCPIAKKKEYTEKIIVPIRDNFPTVTVNTRWTIDDPYREDEMEACFIIPLAFS